MLKIYDTLTRTKRDFHPLEPGKVRMYVCGMTIYDDCHIGHARMMMAFDIVQRWLRVSGYAITYVRNITDIDDKIIQRAAQNGESIQQLTQRYAQRMHEDIDALGILPPDHEPYATQYVPEMLQLIERLVNRGLAYQAQDGDVNYAVRQFPQYGQLSGKSLDELQAGERVAIDQAKHDPLDFVLWKRAKDHEPDEAKWPSRWGVGRPGWHIECSAMSCALLGEHFDIHGGGADLQFPHHENEIAQSQGASGKPFVNYWMHNGFVNVDNQKMSKSLGNFFTIRDLLKTYDGEVLRFFLLRTHYRSQLNFSDHHLEDAKHALTRLYTALKEHTDISDAAIAWNEAHAQRFTQAMNDDFNTPMAVAVLFDLASEINRSPSALAVQQLRGLAGTLGLLERDPRSFLQRQENAQEIAEIEQAIAERTQAKNLKKFAEADRIRAELLGRGITLEDIKTAQGTSTTWRRT